MPTDNENQNKEVTSERRMSFRIPLRILKVNTETNGREIFFGYAKDISVRGMNIQTSNPREVGSRFNLKFELPNKVKMTVEAEVVWIRDYEPLSKTMPGMGIKFIGLSTDNMKELENFIGKASLVV